MRSNSGKDEARNNLHDPTIRDRTIKRAERSRPHSRVASRRRLRITAAAARTSASGNNRRPGRGRGSAPACRRAPASRAPSPRRACLRPRRRSATGCRQDPGPPRRRLRRSGAWRRSARRRGPGRAPSRRDPRATGAASQDMVTRGASCARSQSAAQPLARVELTLADEAAREQPAERRFGSVDVTVAPPAHVPPSIAFAKKARCLHSHLLLVRVRSPLATTAKL